VTDRVAQMVVKQLIEPDLEPIVGPSRKLRPSSPKLYLPYRELQALAVL
jgi:hypothetical protein